MIFFQIDLIGDDEEVDDDTIPLTQTKNEIENPLQLKDSIIHPVPKPQFTEYPFFKEDHRIYKLPQKYIKNDLCNDIEIENRGGDGDNVSGVNDKDDGNNTFDNREGGEIDEKVDYCLDEEVSVF